MGHVLAIDLGTSGVKVAVVADDGRILAAASESYATTFTPDGGAEQDAEVWWQAIGRCSRHAVAASGDTAAGRAAGGGIEAVAVTSQYMSALGIAADGTPVTPCIMWIDHRAAEIRPNIHDDDAFMATLTRHGLIPLPNDDVAHVAWLRRNDPHVDERVAAWVEPGDALTARLTGRITATQTSNFGFMAIDNTVWGATEYDRTLLGFADLTADRLAPLVPANEPIGAVTAAAAEHLAIARTAVVLPATVDSITSAVGTGAVDPSTCGFIIGTTAVCAVHLPEQRSDLEHALTAMPSPIPASYLVMAENGIGGRALDVLVRNVIYADDAFATGQMPTDAFERASAAAATVPPGSEGVLFAPWLVGSMAPSANDDVRGAFVGLGLASTTRAHLVRAVMEGVALNAAWLLPHVAAVAAGDAGAVWDELTLGGGGAASPVWSQIMADVLGMRVRRLAEPGYANARGAGLLAHTQLGRRSIAEIGACLPIAAVHEPDRTSSATYAPMRTALEELHAATAPILRTMHTGRHAPNNPTDG